MNLSTSFILCLVVGSLWLITIYNALHDPITNSQGWITVSLISLTIMVLLVIFLPDQAGYISVGIYIIFGMIPTYVFQKSQKLMDAEKYEEALEVTKTVRWLHPLSSIKRSEDLIIAYRLAEQGKFDEAKEIVRRYISMKSARGRNLFAHIYAWDGDWIGIRQMIEKEVPHKILVNDPRTALNYLRALGETDGHNEMLIFYQKYKRTFSRNPQSLSISRLFVLAFCGCKDEAQLILQHDPISLTMETRKLWWATTELFAWNPKVGYAMFNSLLESEDHVIQKTAKRRLSQNLPILDIVLTPEAKQILYELRELVRKEGLAKQAGL